MSEREERVAKNEATARDINERLEAAQVVVADERFLRVLCECGNAACDFVLALTGEEYEQVRTDPRRFVVRREHVMADVETIVSETERFVVVEKRKGTAAEIVEERDPRS